MSMQLLGDSVDALMAQEWCILLNQPLQFAHVGLRRDLENMAASVRGIVSGSSSSSSSAATLQAQGYTNISNGSFNDTGDPAGMKNRDVLYFCRPQKGAAAGASSSISVGMFHLPGVHLAGPFHTGGLVLLLGG